MFLTIALISSEFFIAGLPSIMLERTNKNDGASSIAIFNIFRIPTSLLAWSLYRTNKNSTMDGCRINVNRVTMYKYK